MSSGRAAPPSGGGPWRAAANEFSPRTGGSLPRHTDLDQLIADPEAGVQVDHSAFDKRVELAVADVVATPARGRSQLRRPYLEPRPREVSCWHLLRVGSAPAGLPAFLGRLHGEHLSEPVA